MPDIPPYLQNPQAQVENDPIADARRAWYKSLATLAAANAADVATSWGGGERNKLLANDEGNFGAKGLAIKSGVVGAEILAQYLLAKKYPKLYRYLKYFNYANALPTAAVAAHNLTVR